MPLGHRQGDFYIQNRSYTLYALHGRIVDVEGSSGQARKIRLSSEDQEMELDIPWQVDVEHDQVIDVVYAVDRDDPDIKKPYYIYNRDTKTVELSDSHPKPNKGLLLAVVDFVLIILLGLAGARLIFPMLEGSHVLWGMGALLVLMVLVYVAVNMLTYRWFFQNELAQLKEMNGTIKALGQKLSKSSQ